MSALKKNDFVQKMWQSWTPVKILSFSQITHCFVQKKRADQTEMLAWLEMSLWNYWEMLGKH